MKSKKNIKNIMIMATLGIVALFFINNSFAANFAKINVETANVRETADANSKILEQFSLNQEVEILEETGDWYKIRAKGITGYIRQDLVTVEKSQEEANNTVTEAKEEVTTNQEKTTDAKVEENKTEKVIDTTEKNEQQEEKAKKVITDTKIKIVPTINATDISELKANEEVTIVETINEWVCVETKTTKGWIIKDKLKSIETVEETEQEPEINEETENTETAEKKPQEEVVLKTLYINSDTVNLRKEANTNSEIISKLSLNTKVEVYSEENGWSKVRVDGKEGYISSELLSQQPKETSRSLEEPRKPEETTKEGTEKETTSNVSSGNGTNVVETAKSYIGSKYVYGATGPTTFDCSGFTYYVFKLYGVTLSRTAAGQYSNGIGVNRSDLQPGDIIMFGPSASGINHVGIYIGGGQIVHAANASRGVTTDTINSGYYNNNYVGARRVL